MKIIVTESQMRELVSEEVSANQVLAMLTNYTNNPTMIYNTLLQAISNGTISPLTVPSILNGLFSGNTGMDTANAAQVKNGILKRLWDALLGKNGEQNQSQNDDRAPGYAKRTATQVSDAAISEISKWETMHDFKYQMSPKDLNGYYVRGENKKTYGYGLRTHPNGKFMEDVKQVWTQPELEQLFKEKINNEAQWVLKWAANNGVKLGQGQLDAMVSAVYNYGRRGFLRTGIPEMIAQNPNDPKIPEVWATASDHHKNMGGLKKRRRVEASWYQNDMNVQPKKA